MYESNKPCFMCQELRKNKFFFVVLLKLHLLHSPVISIGCGLDNFRSWRKMKMLYCLTE